MNIFYHFLMDPRRGGPHQFIDNFVNYTRGKIINKILINGVNKNIDLSFYRNKGRFFYIFEIIINLIKIFLFFNKNKSNSNEVINIHGFYNIAPLIYVLISRRKFNWFIHEEIKERYFFIFDILPKKNQIFFLYNPKQLNMRKRNNFFIIRPSVDTNFWNLKDNNFSNTNFLTVGNLNPLKNHNLLLNSFYKIQKNITLQIAGEKLSSHQQYYNNILILKKKIEKSSKSRISLLGRISKNKIKKKMSQSNFFIMSSKSEGTPFALLEAMSCQKICIIPKIKTLNKIFKDNYNGFYFKNNNIKSLSKVIIKVLNLSKKEKIEIGKRARKLILKEFSNEVFTKKINKTLLKKL